MLRIKDQHGQTTVASLELAREGPVHWLTQICSEDSQIDSMLVPRLFGNSKDGNLVRQV
jgi:hypothetical protein